GTSVAQGSAGIGGDDNALRDEIALHPNRFGVWMSAPLPTDQVFDGTADQHLFDQVQGLVLLGANVDYTAWFQECNPADNNCQTLARADGSMSFGLNLLGGWDSTTVDLGDVHHHVNAGWQVRLVIGFDD